MNKNYEDLLSSLIDDGYLKTPEIIEAFKKVDRADFVLDEYKNSAYENSPLAIGYDQTISQPLTVAFMIELLHPKVGDKVLDIGSGSGWQAAILTEIVANGYDADVENDKNEQDQNNLRGSVVAVERILALKEMTEKNLQKYDLIKHGLVSSIFGDGFKGYKAGAPYDKIIAAATADGEIPVEWKRQLKIGGRIVAPIGSSIVVFDKIAKGKYNKKEYFGFSFVPLLRSTEK